MPAGVFREAYRRPQPRNRFPYDAPAASGPVGNASITLGAATLSATANVTAGPVTANAAITLGAATLSATAGVLVRSTSSITLGAATLSSTASVAWPVVTANASIVLGAAVLASTGKVTVGASASVTLGAATLSGAAGVSVQAASAVTLGAATLAGSSGVPVVGAGSVVLGAAVLAGMGAIQTGVSATAAIMLGEATLVSQAFSNVQPGYLDITETLLYSLVSTDALGPEVEMSDAEAATLEVVEVG